MAWPHRFAAQVFRRVDALDRLEPLPFDVNQVTAAIEVPQTALAIATRSSNDFSRCDQGSVAVQRLEPEGFVGRLVEA